MTLIAETQYRNIGKGYEEVFIKELHNSRKLRKVAAIYKTNKLVPFKKQVSLNPKGSKKLPYSKSSCS